METPLTVLSTFLELGMESSNRGLGLHSQLICSVSNMLPEYNREKISKKLPLPVP